MIRRFVFSTDICNLLKAGLYIIIRREAKNTDPTLQQTLIPLERKPEKHNVYEGNRGVKNSVPTLKPLCNHLQ
jgi:hypothetical protein